MNDRPSKLPPPGLRWTCYLGCGDLIFTDLEDAAAHLAGHGHEPDRWPDGGLVVVDTTLEPAEFAMGGTE